MKLRSGMVSSAIFLWMLALIACSNDGGRLAGSGSVTTNGLTGTVIRDGQPASGILISVFPKSYNPVRDSALPDSRRQVTDRTGNYRFTDIPPGTYNLVAAQVSEPVSESARSILQDIQITADPDSLYILPELTLQPAGTIRIPLPEFARDVSGYFYLPGTGISWILDAAAVETGSIDLVGVPSATYASLLYANPQSDTGRNLLARALGVAPEGRETVKPFGTWKQTWTVSINTTVSGADVSGNLIGFPLLVRLNAGNFDFTAARADGSDLRFTKSDSITALPFEIEAWDATVGTAAIWVRVDTVHGNDQSQFLCLFAGNASAAARSGSDGVFDTAGGYRGVWHLGEDPSAGTDAIRDRTPNAYHGTSGGGMAKEASVPGIIGRGLDFDGRNDLVTLQNSDRFIRSAGQALTLSAWIKPSALKTTGDSICQRLISFKTDSGAFSSLAWGIDNAGRLAHYSRATDSVYHWNTVVAVDSVYHVALSFENGTYTGYVNGRPDYTVTGLDMPAVGALPALVGTHIGGNLQYQGLLDELRIESASRSGGWIRLSYESQKPDASVVKVIHAH